MSAPKLKTRDGSDLYDRDFYAWTQDQAARLRALSDDDRIDLAHLAEEVADLGRSELSKTEQHLTQMLVHLIKAVASQASDSQSSWRQETLTHQIEARRTFSPGMRQHLDVADIWRDALVIANAGLRDYGEKPVQAAPDCPFDLASLLDQAFDVEAAQKRVRHAIEAG